MDNSKVFLYRYNNSSQGGKLLAKALGIKMIKPEGSKFTPAADKAVINWGSGADFPFPVGGTTIINPPEKVHHATHKRKFFELCREAGNVEIPRFTTRRAEAEDWLRDGKVVFGRTKLQGSGGEGIEELKEPDDARRMDDGTLFVEYVKKKHEFRIHVGSGKVIDKQQKKKKNDVDLERVNWRVRNTANGFIFARNEIDVPKAVTEQALAAMKVSGLDFGAVDVLWNEHHKRAVVLEINTAPGLEGSTVLNYARYFKDKLDIRTGVEDVYDVIELARAHGIGINR